MLFFPDWEEICGILGHRMIESGIASPETFVYKGLERNNGQHLKDKPSKLEMNIRRNECDIHSVMRQ